MHANEVGAERTARVDAERSELRARANLLLERERRIETGERELNWKTKELTRDRNLVLDQTREVDLRVRAMELDYHEKEAELAAQVAEYNQKYLECHEELMQAGAEIERTRLLVARQAECLRVRESFVFKAEAVLFTKKLRKSQKMERMRRIREAWVAQFGDTRDVCRSNRRRRPTRKTASDSDLSDDRWETDASSEETGGSRPSSTETSRSTDGKRGGRHHVPPKTAGKNSLKIGSRATSKIQALPEAAELRNLFSMVANQVISNMQRTTTTTNQPRVIQEREKAILEERGRLRKESNRILAASPPRPQATELFPSEPLVETAKIGLAEDATRDESRRPVGQETGEAAKARLAAREWREFHFDRKLASFTSSSTEEDKQREAAEMGALTSPGLVSGLDLLGEPKREKAVTGARLETQDRRKYPFLSTTTATGSSPGVIKSGIPRFEGTELLLRDQLPTPSGLLTRDPLPPPTPKEMEAYFQRYPKGPRRAERTTETSVSLRTSEDLETRWSRGSWLVRPLREASGQVTARSVGDMAEQGGEGVEGSRSVPLAEAVRREDEHATWREAARLLKEAKNMRGE